MILTCYDQLGVEEPGILLQLVIVDVASLGVDLGEEEEGSGTWLCAAGGGAGRLMLAFLTFRGANTCDNCILALAGAALCTL